MLGIYFCPESPRWLMKKGRYPQAFRSFLKLRMHPIIAARDLYYSHVLYEEEVRMARGASYFSRFRDLFTVPRIRRATWASSMVMVSLFLLYHLITILTSSKSLHSKCVALTSSASTHLLSSSKVASLSFRHSTPRSASVPSTCECICLLRLNPLLTASTVQRFRYPRSVPD
jgi:hypothetical protein